MTFRLQSSFSRSQFRFLSNSEADSLSRTLCKNHNWIPLEMGSSKEEEEERSESVTCTCTVC